MQITRKPTHPGEILKEDYLDPLGLSITDLALALGISRKTLSRIVNKKGRITPGIALRLSRAFNTTPDLWLNLQKNYDLWEAMHCSDKWKTVQPIAAFG